MKKSLIILFVLLSVIGCKKDKIVANKSSDIYQITKMKREVWDSNGLVKEETIACKYTFYLEAPSRPGFNNGICRIDSMGTEPSFLKELKLHLFFGLDRFTCEWNIGPGDDKRLSFIKPDPTGFGDNSQTVNIKRNSLGKVTSFTFIDPEPGGGFIFEEYELE